MSKRNTTKRFVGANHDIEQACDLLNANFVSTNPAKPILAQIVKNTDNDRKELLVFYGNLQVTENILARFDGLMQFLNLRAVI